MYMSAINGNDRIQKYAPGVPDWKQVNINGFGTPTTQLIHLQPFNGQLYAGSGDWDLWCTDVAHCQWHALEPSN